MADNEDKPATPGPSAPQGGQPTATAASTPLTPDGDEAAAAAKRRELLIKQLSQVVCICKGIKLGRVLKGLEGSQTVEDVNRKVGTGSGGCAGERCGPRIKALLKKKNA